MKKVPSGAQALGVLLLITSVLNIMSDILFGIWLLFYNQLSTSVANFLNYMYQETTFPMWFNIVHIIMSLIILASAIGLIKGKKWA